MKIEDVTKENVFKLVYAYLKGAKQLATLEKQYVKEEVGAHVKTLSIWIVLAVGGLVCLALGGLVLLVAVILFLNTWFVPWASALIVTIALLSIGAVLAVIGLSKAKIDLDQTKATIEQVGKDIRWVRQR
ncbi:MAG TPA: phage holin family protein [Deltaproteobacteria bacterium]|nr:phage holin family protein [Deltaproteobacteria bacterium]